MRVSGFTFKTSFRCLLVIFSVVFIIEFICTAFGHPIAKIHIEGLDLEQQSIEIWLLRALLSSLFISGIVNFFLTVKIIKEAKQLKHWSAPLVVLMTVFFPLECIISMIAVIPNIIIFGILGRTKKVVN